MSRSHYADAAKSARLKKMLAVIDCRYNGRTATGRKIYMYRLVAA
jgi:hypothetical protein